MRSSYKPVGRFIRLVKTRNAGLEVTELRGIRINKEFMPSVANVIGTDLENYKVVRKNQFAYNPMHVGRDEILPIARLDSEEPVIVSPAYVVFEIRNTDELLPEYLMMWCRRPEFDRQAWFTTDSSVRGGFDWKDFCEMEMPVPSPEKQREIVAEYETVVKRIALNEKLGRKLEETAQAIYKHWFVDFEFPMSAEVAKNLGRPGLEGKPYKSSGGELEFDESLKRELPRSWNSIKLGQEFRLRYGKNLPTTQLMDTGFDVYGGNGVIVKFSRFIYKQRKVILACRGAASGKVNFTRGYAFVTNNSIVVENTSDTIFPYLKYACLNYNFEEHVTGSAQPQLTIDGLDDVYLAKPSESEVSSFFRIAAPILAEIENSLRKEGALGVLRETLLASLASK